ncbi:helix-turn-helix transcriptional regulator [Actinomadura alba]|uniref:Helix-turn-helix transcriptional regulator n=1 Tax=Actinomadura alba TaxID=406431 RepID=A0ABR7LS36_9ACTN|nr:helix-turn-helix transcriptional regulator [Actinomadura alba]MBC6467656.1 helix-turn-helix transcriptional regulator [Actinomadura alba]
MDLRELAAQAFVDFSQLAKWERGVRSVPADAISRLDDALEAGSHLVALYAAVTELDDLRARQFRGEQSTDGSYEVQMDQSRRRILQSLAALGASSASATALEQIRHAFVSVLPDDRRYVIADWEEITADHGHAFLTTPAAELLSDIAADAVALQQVIRNSDERASGELYRPAGQLAALMALTLGCLREKREARHWWQIARHAADASEDLTLRVWVRGYEAMSSLYERRPLQVVISRAEEAISIAGDSRCPAVLEAMAARAQALAALGQPREAEATMRSMETVWEKQPSGSPHDRLSARIWPETALRHTQSWVYAHTGSPAADDAQEAALALYPPQMCRQAAQINLLRAVSLIRGGHIGDGVEHAGRVVEALPAGHRTMGVEQNARDVLALVPESETERPAVVEYRELLSLSAPGSA